MCLGLSGIDGWVLLVVIEDYVLSIIVVIGELKCIVFLVFFVLWGFLVWRVDNVIWKINFYLVDSVIYVLNNLGL